MTELLDIFDSLQRYFG